VFVPPPTLPVHAAGASGPAAGPPPRAPRGRRPVRTFAFRQPVPGARTAALLAAGVALAVYAWGAAPTVLSGDSAELAATAFRGGVPHTPGYPTFALLGQVAGRLLPGDPAHRITLMCGVAGAMSVALFAMLLAELGLAWGAVLGGAVLYAGTFTLWWASIHVEVYALATALAVFALWRVLVARRTLAPRDGLLAAFAIGLALTGHLLFGPALAIAGLALAGRALRAGALSFPLAIGVAFMLALGLSPYLYLVFADHHYTLTNYLHYAIEPAGGQYGLTPSRFDSTPERMLFLLLGPESRPHDFLHHLPTALANMGVAWGQFVAFEVGPLAALLGLGGTAALWGRDRGAARLLLAIALVSPLYAALVVDGPLLDVFMLSSTLAVSGLAACGLDALFARVRSSAPLAVAVALAAVALSHELRVRADARPLGAPWMHVQEKGSPHITTFVPQLRHEHLARDRAQEILAAIPESSFVAARWEQVMTMKYLQSAEGVRTDLTLDPWYEPSHVVRLERWQHAHALRTHPVVMVDQIPGLVVRLQNADIRRLRNGTRLWIERHGVVTH
jgi:hypothetical protein